MVTFSCTVSLPDAAMVSNTASHPDLMVLDLPMIMFCTQCITRARTSGEGDLSAMCSNGRRKRSWNANPTNSSLSRNLSDSCFSESTAYMDTGMLGWHPAAQKWSAIEAHILPHDTRGRVPMLKSATSTIFCSEKMRGRVLRAHG
jgi:hypothetical protein